MAFINFENLPSENTPLTGGEGGNLNVMQEIVNVSNEVDEDYRVNLIETKNLFDKDNVILGYFISSNGTPTSDANSFYSHFIEVKPNTAYYISGRTSLSAICLYNASGTFIDRLYTTNNNDTFTITNTNVKYIRLNGTITDLDTTQLEEGNEATTYKEFIQNQILVDNEKYTDTLNVGSVVDSRSRVNVLYSKNLLSTSLELGTFTNSGVKDTSTTNYRTANMVKVKPNTTYTTSINGTAQAYALYFYTSSGVYISSTTTATFTTPANCEYLNFRCFNADFTSDFANLKVQLEEGSSATSYEPYITPSIVVDNEEIYSKPVVLWQNGSPTSAFASQTIALSSDNYDYFDLFYKQGTSSTMIMCTRVLKGYGTRVILSSVNSSYAGGLVYQRNLTRTNDTTYTLGDCSKQSGTTVETDNASLIPIQILGYK